MKSSFTANWLQPYPWFILCISVIPPPWMGLDLLSTFVLNRYIFVVFLQKKIQTLLLKMSCRGCVRTPTLPVALALCKMILLAHHSDPELETVWVMLWCITVAVLLLIIVCIESPPPRRFVRWLYHLLNKCVISLMGLIFVSHLSLLLWGDALDVNLGCFLGITNKKGKDGVY